MRKWIAGMLGKKLSRPQEQICQHKYLHESKRIQKLVSYTRDYCAGCDEYICHQCSEMHNGSHCTLKTDTMPVLNSPLNSNPYALILPEKSDNLLLFNIGHLMKCDLSGLRCICGELLSHESINHAICAACGLASCSSACHHEWEKQGNCIYHRNFLKVNDEVSMRSILFRNIFNIRKAKISSWSIANKTALNYISCYVNSKFPHVYFQRGYRIYGKPHDSLLDRMKMVPPGLDFTTHIERLCRCNCEECLNRGHHTVGNCQMRCDEAPDRIINHQARAEMHYQCSCNCPFCSSGIIVNRHTRMDCLFYCKRIVKP